MKLDASFVARVDTDHDNANMVRAMIDLAENLGMTALAEGIETEGELAFLVQHGCRRGQGSCSVLRCRPRSWARSFALGADR